MHKVGNLFLLSKEPSTRSLSLLSNSQTNQVSWIGFVAQNNLLIHFENGYWALMQTDGQACKISPTLQSALFSQNSWSQIESHVSANKQTLLVLRSQASKLLVVLTLNAAADLTNAAKFDLDTLPELKGTSPHFF